MSEDRRVLAVIPVFHKYEQRDRCVAALERQTVPVEIFIHDNSAENIGFTKACNRGLREAFKRGCTYAMLLNQDCYPEPDMVERLITFMEQHPRCAIAGPMQISAEEPDKVLNAGGLTAFPFGHHRGSRAAGDFSTSEQVAWINGACMFARLDAVLDFGLLDEGMFLIGSDSDWSLTARARGWEVWYCAQARVLHEGGVTNAMPKLETQRIFHRDMDFWRRKWVGSVVHRHLDRPVGQPHLTVPPAHAIQQAAAALQAGRLADAEVGLCDILEVDPQNVNALNLLGVMAVQSQLMVVGYDYFCRAIEIAPTHPQLFIHRATVLVCIGKNEEAMRDFVEAARLENRSTQLLESIANELAKIGYAGEAATAKAKAATIRQTTAPGLGIMRQQ